MPHNTIAQHFETHINIDKPDINAVDALANETTLSKQKIKEAMQKGAVWLTRNEYTQRLRRIKKPLVIGDALHLYYDEDILATEPLPPRLIADEHAYSVWYKTYGLYCQGSKWGDHCTINRWIEQHTQRPAFIVHRLDRATTGLIVIAHQKKAAAQLSALFAQRKIDKRYHAIVHGHYPATETAQTIDSNIDSRSAVSQVTRIHFDDELQQSLLSVKIETGRKHQIRRHLAEAGYPIIGDRLYGKDSGSEQSENNQNTINLQLCCYFLSFNCPLSGEMKSYQLDGESTRPASL